MGHAKVHEKYAYTDGQRGYYDIAVLTLDSDIKYEPLTVQPICLPYKANNQQNFWYNKTGVITGYAHQDKSATYLELFPFRVIIYPSNVTINSLLSYFSLALWLRPHRYLLE